MKKIVICLGLLFAGLAHADELADANALFQKKAYPQALQLYTKLANAGNAEAQLHLGEMYWYGEAGAIDMPRPTRGSGRLRRKATRPPPPRSR